MVGEKEKLKIIYLLINLSILAGIDPHLQKIIPITFFQNDGLIKSRQHLLTAY